MLKLLVFLACEKMIIDKEEMASVINVLDSVTVELDGKTELKNDAASPFGWEVFAIWRRIDALVSGKKFEQRVTLIDPDGNLVFEVVQPLTIDNIHLNFRAHLKVGAMPVGKKGSLSLRIYLREGSSKWQEKGEYPIQIVHKMKEEAKVGKKRIKKRRV